MLDQTGQLKNTIGSGGSGDGQLSIPYGLSIKGDVLYVADYGNRHVQKLTSRGEFLHKFGQKGSGQGQLDVHMAVIVDSNNRLIIFVRSNHMIQIFNEYGGWLLTIDGKGSGNNCFHYPCMGPCLREHSCCSLWIKCCQSLHKGRCICQKI